MNVLVVDDDAGVRQVVRRLIERDFKVTVIEANGGTQALDILLHQDIHFVLMDVVMPVIDGLETLRLIRRSPKLAALPVVLLTGMPDEDKVRQAIGLKVVEFVAKPVSPATFRERIAPLIAVVWAAEAPPPSPSDSLLDLSPARRVLFVDRNAECRAAALTVLSRLCHAEAMDNEFAALTRCLEEPPDILFIGLTSGLSSAEEFVERLRSHTALRSMRLVAVVPTEQAENARKSELYTCALERALASSDFERSLGKYVTPQTRARLLLHGSAAWTHRELLEAMRQELGSITHDDVVIRKDRVGPLALRWVVSSVELQCGPSAWAVRFECPFPTALNLAKLVHHGDSDEVTEANAVNAITCAAKQLGQRVQSAAAISELTCQLNSTTTSLQGTPAATSELGASAVSWRFAGKDGADLGVVSVVPY